MSVGDLVKVSFAEGTYYAIVTKYYHPPSYPNRGEWTMLFCDGDVGTYTQESLDYEEIIVEIVSENR